MTTKPSHILKIMHVIFWIIFIGLCIQIGAMLISFCVSLFINPEAAKNLYNGLNLHDLYSFGKSHYFIFAALLILLSGFKAYIAFLVIRIFLKFDLSNPFNHQSAALISKISHVALSAGLHALIMNIYANWLIDRGLSVSEKWGAGELLFLAGVIFIIAHVFKRGVEIQAENELTV